MIVVYILMLASTESIFTFFSIDTGWPNCVKKYQNEIATHRNVKSNIFPFSVLENECLYIGMDNQTAFLLFPLKEHFSLRM